MCFGVSDNYRSRSGVIDRDRVCSVTEIDQLQTAQKHTDEKLNILIDTVDRIIRNRNGDGHQA